MEDTERCLLWHGMFLFCGVLERTLWYVGQLGGHHTGGDLRYGGPVADYSSWS